MYNHNKLEKATFNVVACWLLEYPPLSEIGGNICDVIEQYRDGFVTEQYALKFIEAHYMPVVEKYIKRSSEILDLMY